MWLHYPGILVSRLYNCEHAYMFFLLRLLLAYPHIEFMPKWIHEEEGANGDIKKCNELLKAESLKTIEVGEMLSIILTRNKDDLINIFPINYGKKCKELLEKQ